MIIVDSVVWIAFKNKRDSWNKQASKILPRIINRNKIVYVTDYIILEVINFLNRKTSNKTAIETLDMFSKSEKINIIYNDEVTFLATKNIMKKYPKLSFTDANIILNMMENNIKQICSFDQGFSKIKDIEVVN